MLKQDFIAVVCKGTDVYHAGKNAGKKYAYIQVRVQDYARDSVKLTGEKRMVDGFWYKSAPFHFEEVGGRKHKVYDGEGGFRCVDTPEMREWVAAHLIEGAKLPWKASKKKSAPKAKAKAEPVIDLTKLSPAQRKKVYKALGLA